LRQLARVASDHARAARNPGLQSVLHRGTPWSDDDRRPEFVYFKDLPALSGNAGEHAIGHDAGGFGMFSRECMLFYLDWWP
jgi:hypothetical protein